MTTVEQLAAELAELKATLAPLLEPRAAVPPVQVGDLTSVPTPGANISSQWAQDATARTMGRYATTAARDAAWNASAVAKAKGTPSYLAASDAPEGPEYWNGAAWRRPWNMPWGRMGSAQPSSDQIGIGATTTDLTGFSLAVTAIQGRRYRVHFGVALRQNTATGVCVVILTDEANVSFGSIVADMTGPGTIFTRGGAIDVPATYIGAKTFKLRGYTTAGTMDVVNASYAGGRFMVDDSGPIVGYNPS